MTQRRMFSKEIIESDYFLDLPLTTQALYFHLCLNADDEGFVKNAKSIARLIGANLTEVGLLIEKGFLINLDGKILIVTHWFIHNQIRADRKKDTIFKTLKEMLYLNEDRVYSVIDKNTLETNSEKKVILGNFNNVFLTDDEYKNFIDKVGEVKAQELINRLSNYMKQTNKSYSNHLATLYTFFDNDNKNNKSDNDNKNIDYDDVSFESL